MFGSVLFSLAALTVPSPSVCYSVAETPSTRGPTLYGDIDGDGAADAVWTEAEWLDVRRCRAFLVVRTAKRIFRIGVVSESGLLAPPGLAGLVRLDRRPGLQIAVITVVGASTWGIVVYRLRSGRLAPLEGPLFGQGGSVMNRRGVDCLRGRGALVVSTSASYRTATRRYVVERRFYGLRGGAFALRYRARYRVPQSGLLRFPELAAETQPFPSCAVVP